MLAFTSSMSALGLFAPAYGLLPKPHLVTPICAAVLWTVWLMKLYRHRIGGSHWAIYLGISVAWSIVGTLLGTYVGSLIT
jgi:hypothetical protein